MFFYSLVGKEDEEIFFIYLVYFGGSSVVENNTIHYIEFMNIKAFCQDQEDNRVKEDKVHSLYR